MVPLPRRVGGGATRSYAYLLIIEIEKRSGETAREVAEFEKQRTSSLEIKESRVIEKMMLVTGWVYTSLCLPHPQRKACLSQTLLPVMRQCSSIQIRRQHRVEDLLNHGRMRCYRSSYSRLASGWASILVIDD